MELKDVILSTLAEMEDTTAQLEQAQETVSSIDDTEEFFQASKDIDTVEVQSKSGGSTIENELMYLNSIRERLLVLFEGFQAPNNSNIEAKVDMTLNFLEYVLATVDNRIDILNKGN